MEILKIENFLSIRSAKIEVRRINILIGPQASGKSIIAKLLYFFKQEIGEAFQESVRNHQGKRELSSALAAKFEIIFPRSYWNNQEFSIYYDCHDLNITIKGIKSKSGRMALSIEFSGWLPRFQTTLKKQYKSALEQTKQKSEDPNYLFGKDERFIFSRFFDNQISNSEYSRHFERQIFIPASRTFFATLQKNIFAFLSSNIDIDYFLKEFGSVYEKAKRILYLVQRSPVAKADQRKQINRIMENIIAGRYVYENEQDWIENTVRKINLANASSGQQESLPMLLVLSVMPFFGKEKNGYFIEEPEAHLFPVSQQAFISLLALLANTTKHQFFITTHSPYLLTALNNCIIAHSTYEAVDDEGKEKVIALMPKNQHIAFSDVAAWTVTAKGTVESILDQENQLIGASLLDSVSQHFETVTNSLLDIRYGESA